MNNQEYYENINGTSDNSTPESGRADCAVEPVSVCDSGPYTVYGAPLFSPIPAVPAAPVFSPIPAIPAAPVKKRRGRGMKTVFAVICAIVLMLSSGFAGAKIYEARLNSLTFSSETVKTYSPGTDVISNDLSTGSISRDVDKSDSSGSSNGSSVGDNFVDSESDDDSSGNGNNSLGSPNSNGSTLSPTELFAGANPAVVAISTETIGHNVFGRPVTYPAAGSGFIISDDGYIVTNNHVIEGANSISILLHDGTSQPATLVGRDPNSDLAVLKIDMQGLSYLTWGASDTLKVGEQVAAIGNPLGEFANSMTVGYISALNREINIDGTPRNMLQTDTAVNEGNSGGPLLNMKGQVIGIVSAKSTGMNVEGLGFAIPSNEAKVVIEHLIRDGYVKGRAVMGVTISTSEIDGKPGVIVMTVNSGSAAEKAGVKVDDIILSANKIAVSTVEELKEIVNAMSPGDKLTLNIKRGNQDISLTVTLDEYRPSEAERSLPSYNQNPNNPYEDENIPFDPWDFFPGMDEMFPQDGGFN